MSISKACSLEIFDLLHKAQAASEKGNKELSAIYRSKVDVLRMSGVSSAELCSTYAEALGESLVVKQDSFEARYNYGFGKFLAGKLNDTELRAIADSGTAPNSQTFTDGVQGGYFVSQQFDRTLRDAKIQTDPVVNPDVVSVIQEPGYVMGAKNVTGFDLTTVVASSTADGTQQTETSIATQAHNAQISNYPTYKVNIATSLEAEEDIDQFQARVAGAVAVAMARKQGQDVINTLATSIASTYETPTSGVVTITDLQNIVFQIDRLYRQGTDGYGYVNIGTPRKGTCGWLMGDDVWGLLNRMGSGQANGQAGGNPQVPYLSALCSPGAESLLGYPVHICPSLASSISASPVKNATIYFGDLSKIVVRKSQVWAKRTLQSAINPGSVNYGQALLVFRQRAGAVYFDPGVATSPAVVAATVRV